MNSLVHKLTIIFIIAVLLPTMILCIATFQTQQDSYQSKLYSSYEMMLSEYMNQVIFRLDQYKNIMDELSVNPEIVQLTRNPEQSKMFDLSNSGLQNLSLEGEIFRCTLYSSFAGDDFPYSIEAIEKTEWYQQLIERKTYTEWFYFGEKSSGKAYLSLVRPVVDVENWVRGSGVLGILKLDIFADVLFSKYFPESWNNKVNMILFTRNKELIFTRESEPGKLENMMRGSIGEKEWLNGKKFGGKSDFLPENIAFEKLVNQNIYILSEINIAQVENNLKGILLWIIYICLMLGTLFFVLSSFIQTISRRISILITKMQRLEDLDFSIREHVGGNDEITLIDEAFDRMATRMKALIEQNYEQQINLKNAQLSSMHFQIKPHFLYNALESISSIAAVEGSIKASTMSQKLGKLFRYSTYMTQGDMVLLKEELQYVISYIDIQNVRFENKFVLETDIAEELMEIPVLKFCIQPFIENIIRYAFDEDDTHCIIRVSASRSGNDVNLIVTDYGSGIDEDTLGRIQASLDCSSTHVSEHVGILNVHVRVQLAYGVGYGVTVESTPDVGTVITVKFHI